MENNIVEGASTSGTATQEKNASNKSQVLIITPDQLLKMGIAAKLNAPKVLSTLASHEEQTSPKSLISNIKDKLSVLLKPDTKKKGESSRLENMVNSTTISVDKNNSPMKEKDISKLLTRKPPIRIRGIDAPPKEMYMKKTDESTRKSTEKKLSEVDSNITETSETSKTVDSPKTPETTTIDDPKLTENSNKVEIKTSNTVVTSKISDNSPEKELSDNSQEKSSTIDDTEKKSTSTIILNSKSLIDLQSNIITNDPDSSSTNKSDSGKIKILNVETIIPENVTSEKSPTVESSPFNTDDIKIITVSSRRNSTGNSEGDCVVINVEIEQKESVKPKVEQKQEPKVDRSGFKSYLKYSNFTRTKPIASLTAVDAKETTEDGKTELPKNDSEEIAAKSKEEETPDKSINEDRKDTTNDIEDEYMIENNSEFVKESDEKVTSDSEKVDEDPLNTTQDETLNDSKSSQGESTPKRKRGRPRKDSTVVTDPAAVVKKKVQKENKDKTDTNSNNVQKVKKNKEGNSGGDGVTPKRKRGRPSKADLLSRSVSENSEIVKKPKESEDSEESAADKSIDSGKPVNSSTPIPKKRGRPKKTEAMKRLADDNFTLPLPIKQKIAASTLAVSRCGRKRKRVDYSAMNEGNFELNDDEDDDLHISLDELILLTKKTKVDKDQSRESEDMETDSEDEGEEEVEEEMKELWDSVIINTKDKKEDEDSDSDSDDEDDDETDDKAKETPKKKTDDDIKELEDLLESTSDVAMAEKKNSPSKSENKEKRDDGKEDGESKIEDDLSMIHSEVKDHIEMKENKLKSDTNDEETKDEETKDEKAKDEKAKDEEAKDEEAKDEKAKDEKANNGKAKDEKTNDGKAKDEKAKDEKAKESTVKAEDKLTKESPTKVVKKVEKRPLSSVDKKKKSVEAKIEVESPPKKKRGRPFKVKPTEEVKTPEKAKVVEKKSVESEVVDDKQEKESSPDAEEITVGKIAKIKRSRELLQKQEDEKKKDSEKSSETDKSNPSEESCKKDKEEVKEKSTAKVEQGKKESHVGESTPKKEKDEATKKREKSPHSETKKKRSPSRESKTKIDKDETPKKHDKRSDSESGKKRSPSRESKSKSDKDSSRKSDKSSHSDSKRKNSPMRDNKSKSSREDKSERSDKKREDYSKDSSRKSSSSSSSSSSKVPEGKGRRSLQKINPSKKITKIDKDKQDVKTSSHSKSSDKEKIKPGKSSKAPVFTPIAETPLGKWSQIKTYAPRRKSVVKTEEVKPVITPEVVTEVVTEKLPEKYNFNTKVAGFVWQIREEPTLLHPINIYNRLLETPTTITDDKDTEQNHGTVICAVCETLLPVRSFPVHNLRKHYGLSWIKGETAPKLNDTNIVVDILKRSEEFTCDSCKDLTMSTVLEYLEHVVDCGKSAEEKVKLRESREVWMSEYKEEAKSESSNIDLDLAEEAKNNITTVDDSELTDISEDTIKDLVSAKKKGKKPKKINTEERSQNVESNSTGEEISDTVKSKDDSIDKDDKDTEVSTKEDEATCIDNNTSISNSNDKSDIDVNKYKNTAQMVLEVLLQQVKDDPDGVNAINIFGKLDLKQLEKMCKTSKEFICALCATEVKYFSNHNTKVHNQLSWRVGIDKPKNLHDNECVLSILNSMYQMKKKLKCERCHERKVTPVGFLSHLTICNKPKSFTESLKIPCRMCGYKLMPTSYASHYTDCKSGNLSKKKDRMSKVTEKEEEELPRKRKAASRASLNIETIAKSGLIIQGTEDELTQFYKKDYLFRPTKRLASVVQKEIRRKKVGTCKFSECDFKTTSTEIMVQHLFSCVKKPVKNFTCTRCFLLYENEKEVQNHVDNVHVNVECMNANDTPSSSEEIESDVESVENNNDNRKPRVYEPPAAAKIYNLKILYTGKHMNQNHCLPDGYYLLYQWHLEFVKKHYSNKLFPLNNTSNNWSNVPIVNISSYLPKLRTSISVSHRSVIKVGNPVYERYNDKWKTYKLFESQIVNDSSTLFCGGPITSLSWAPTPLDVTVDQYLAVSVQRDPETAHRINEIQQSNNNTSSSGHVIQLWNCGKLTNQSKATSAPSLAYCIAHNHGPVFAMEWCPSGCYDREEDKGRLGLLAVAAKDGGVHVYEMKKEGDVVDNGSRIFKTNPTYQLQLYITTELFLGEKTTYPLSLSWTKAKNHQYIAVGYCIGMVALYDILTESPLLKSTNSEEVTIIKPYLFFQGHKGPVSAINLHYLNDGRRWLATFSMDRQLKVWDLENPSDPIYFFLRHHMSDGVWPIHWLTMLLGYDDCSNSTTLASTLVHLKEYSGAMHSCLASYSRTNSLDISDWSNVFIQTNAMGEIIGCIQNVMIPKSLEIRNSKFVVSYLGLVNKSLSFEQQRESEKTTTNAMLKATKKTKEIPLQELTYAGMKENCGLILCDIPLTNRRYLIRSQKHQCPMKELNAISRPNCYPIQSVNKIAINPNHQAYLHMATGYQAGFVRIFFTQFSTST